MELVLKLRQGEVCDVQANIKEPVKLLKKIRPRNIDQGRGIIAELLLHLAISYRDTKIPTNVDHLQRILSDALDHLPRFLQSLDVLIERNEAAALVQAVFHLRSNLFSSILTSQDPSLDSPVPSRVLAVLSALELAQLKAISESDSSFKKRIEALHDVTLLITHLPRTSPGWRWIGEAQVRFSRLNQRTSPEVLSELIALDALSPSVSMLRLVALNGQQPPEHQPPVTISQLIASERISGLREFITKYADTIISELVAQAVKLDESADVVLMATKAIKDNEKLARRYFTLTSCSFPALDDLDPHLWDSAMRANRITDRVGALKSYEAQRPRTGDNLKDEIDERAIRIILSDYATQDAETLGRALWTGKEEDERLQEWIATESNLDDEAVLALTSTMVITASEILTDAVSDSRLRLLAQHGRLELCESIWTVLAERDFTALASYVGCQWNDVRLTELESRIDFPLATRLYLVGAMPIDDALRVFAVMGEDLLNEKEEVLGHLAEQATKAGMAFQIGLAELASKKLQSGTYEKKWTMSLLVQAMPVISWPVASVALIALGGDLARLAEGRSVEIPHTDGVPRLLNALKDRGFASSSSPGKNGTKVNMRRKLGDQMRT
ncbi:hypothetical protein H3005_05035 [Stenotrophomonas sp. Br8]|uniref:hypothetical protein n=1 Tax=Stenotrophomonas sp. Br8 TaxID=2759658 RepID=UPI00168BFB9C|nr:hypothetical protein [Stenotrophomonas sp. Br8]MBD3681226.1 hypothetical protein [Stenotrophomonas sp. Br8]